MSMEKALAGALEKSVKALEYALHIVELMSDEDDPPPEDTDIGEALHEVQRLHRIASRQAQMEEARLITQARGRESE